jgi:hypothetical protein
MTQATMIQQVYERMPDAISNEKIDDGAVRQALNMAYQTVFQQAVAAMPDFYNRHNGTFTNATSISLPSDFYELLLIEVPAASRGAARVVPHTDFERINENLVSQGVASSPVAVIDNGVINFSTACTGTLWYKFKFGFITDDTTEITEPNATTLALIPVAFEEDILLEAVRIMRNRYEQDDADIDNAIEGSLQNFLLTTAALEVEKTPEAVYKRQTSL